MTKADEKRVFGLAVKLPTEEGQPEKHVSLRLSFDFEDLEEEHVGPICNRYLPGFLREIYDMLRTTGTPDLQRSAKAFEIDAQNGSIPVEIPCGPKNWQERELEELSLRFPVDSFVVLHDTNARMLILGHEIVQDHTPIHLAGQRAAAFIPGRIKRILHVFDVDQRDAIKIDANQVKYVEFSVDGDSRHIAEWE